MKSISLWMAFLISVVVLSLQLENTPKNLQKYAKQTVLFKGREQPMDTVARGLLIQLNGKQSYLDSTGKKHPAIELLHHLSGNLDTASASKVFRIDNLLLKSQIDPQNTDRQFFCYQEIKGARPVLGSSLEQMINSENVDHDYVKALDQLSYRITLFEQTHEWLVALENNQTILPKAFKVSAEVFFNSYKPYIRSIILYLLSFLSVLIFWLTSKKVTLKAAYVLVVSGLSLHTVGILTRVYIMGTPPVTNLYTSVVFVGFACVLLGVGIEKKLRNGLGLLPATISGVCSLIVAHNLLDYDSFSGVIPAVIKSNFWLTIHVITISLGYSGALITGILGCLQIFRKNLKLTESVYGMTCFAMFFCLTGTLLGGIWADQAWGRFWGWDPKENGALMIILWFVLMLHAKKAQIVTDYTFCLLAIVGNCIVAWAWFGTNLLGVGLHSYGFIPKGMMVLLFFYLSQILIILYGLISRPKEA